MLAVTQFEVYVLENGRWTLHARYPSEDKREALYDARTTEITTGFPSKVVRETFFPELNESERITTYISPKAKKATKGKSIEEAAREQPPVRGRLRRGRVQPVNASQTALRVIVAAGFSLVGAALTAGVINWMLRQFGDLGLALPASMESMLVTYSYVAMFLLFFLSLFRSRLPLHRLLADLWTKSQAVAEGPRLKDAKPARVKPKYDRAASPETLREWQEMRQRRGDPDIFTEAAESATAAVAPGPPAPPPALPVPAPPELNAPVKIEPKAEKPKPPQPAPQSAKAEPPAKPAAKAKPPEAPLPEDETDFAHVELQHFASEIARPAVLATMPDDPVTRRAVALLLSGAMDVIMERPEARSATPSALLAWGLKQAGLSQGVIDLFVLQRPIHVALSTNQPLVAGGRAAMEHLLARDKTVKELIDTMAVTLAAWRTPYGQPGLYVPVADTGVEAAAMALVDVFLLTEIRPRATAGDTPEQVAENEARLAAHNERVRAALARDHGAELKHTGKGIFARFANAATAVACAEALSRDLGATTAIAVIGNTLADEDPTLSATLFLRAEAAVAQTLDGQATIDPHVMSEGHITEQPPDMPAVAVAPSAAGDAAMVA